MISSEVSQPCPANLLADMPIVTGRRHHRPSREKGSEREHHQRQGRGGESVIIEEGRSSQIISQVLKMAPSRADKGKQRAIDQDEDNHSDDCVDDAAAAQTMMDLDEESDDGQEAALAAEAGQETTPAKRDNANNDNLGSSVSRSARMRATMTPDELENGDGSDGSSSSHTSDSDNEEEKRVQDSFVNPKKRKATSSSGPFVTASNGEAYLRATSRPAKTSNKKLSEAFTSSAFTHSTYLQALEKASKSERSLALEEKLLQLETAYDQLHSQWAFELQEGFSLFFYGLGSKIRVLNNFVERYLQKKQKNKRNKGKVVVINGFMAALGIDDILSALESIVQPADTAENDEEVATARNAGKSAAKLDERAKEVVEALNSSSSHYHAKRPIYLLIHNIDGPSLRSFRAQAILSLLVSQPAIRLITSIDHIRAPLLFPSSLGNARPSSLPSSGLSDSTEYKRGYQILYHHIPTHRPYTLEALHSGITASLFPSTIFISEGLFANGTNGAGPATSEARAKAAFFVLASLPQKAKDLFVLLAERQISLSDSTTTSSRKKNKESVLLDAEKTPNCATLYSTLFSLARDKFLANNLNQIEALLREFRDHSVILSNRSAPEGAVQDGEDEDAEDVGNRKGEWVWIGIENDDLEALVEKIGS